MIQINMTEIPCILLMLVNKTATITAIPENYINFAIQSQLNGFLQS